ncbi:hypothetical protein PLESTB_000581200 [Pleodorina starrii]|uniref:Ankyrin repeat domain-containing protein n=1 Tax=Pleodorina starrii TaxID=330485 RepID=A0A9W6BHU8_9CHLO|nr:hypothetical protein PLESTM_000303200 [Pleodorina starrii]GLC52085.1 hypothetical protein PLESTB_000581200 [Pleodorina starrii]GLC72228.1 hypothetical protein PLESTF_001221400 [Pleodorina starrii]
MAATDHHHSASRVWIPSIVACIARHLPPNEIACTLRLVDKTTAHQFHDCKAVRLSLHSPSHAFRERWGRPGSLRGLTREQRLQLLCLTAASGSLPNLELALAANVGLPLTGELLEAAAAAGQLEVCKLLRARGCPWGGTALDAAARGGHRHVCEWLLAGGCPVDSSAVCEAARGGHEGLMEWLLERLLIIQQQQQQQQQDSAAAAAAAGRITGVSVVGGGTAAAAVAVEVDVARMAAAIAEGLGLAALQRLLLQQQQGDDGGAQQQQQPRTSGLNQSQRAGVLAAAAGSPTPDWQAKVEWLEALGYPPTSEACTAATRMSPDAAAAAHLQWLRGRGYSLGPGTAGEAASCGNLAALRVLLEEEETGVRPLIGLGTAGHSAAGRGHLAVLQYLHARRCPLDARLIARGAAEGGQLHVVVWAVEALGVTPDSAGDLLDVAARSGSTGLMAWLRERGWAWGPKAVHNAVEGGCEEALEWLMERGCPLPEDGTPYREAACADDSAMLRCLHRLGCPWGGPDLLAECIYRGSSSLLPALQCLLGLGCPVDWDKAVRAAETRAQMTPGARQTALLEWLCEERQQRSPAAGATAAKGAAAAAAASIMMDPRASGGMSTE